MKVGFLSQNRQRDLSGINRMTVEEISSLIRIDKNNEYCFLGNTDWLNIDIPYIPIMADLNGINQLNYLCMSNDLDVIHSFFRPFHVNEAIRCKKILTISDLSPIVIPYSCNKAMTDYFEGPIRHSASEMDYIVAISEYTKRDIVEIFNIPDEKVKVVYLGLYGDHSSLEKDMVSMERRVGDNFILTVSDMNPRKNHKGLVDAFCLYKEMNPKSSLRLVVAGSNDINRIKELMENHIRFEKDICFIGYVDNAQLNWLYKYSKAVIYPSFFEGFGLPVLEALALGKAVITSNTTSIPEVGGDAVEYCNPYENESIADSIFRVVENDTYRNELEKRATIQASKFSYEKAAKQLLDIYNI